MMRTITRIMITELRVLFYSPIAWLILIVFAIQAGSVFSEGVMTFYVSQVSGGENTDLTQSVYAPLFRVMIGNLYLYVPLLTMGLMSREFGSGSIKLLYSSPVSNAQIIGGKYLSMMLLGLGFTAIMAIPAVAGHWMIENFDAGVTVVSLIGFYLTFCTYAAIGLFMSTITGYQVVAALGTLTVLAILSFIGSVGQSMDFVRDITGWLSVTGRTRDILKGIIGTADVLYFLLVIFLFLSLSVLKLRGEQLRLPARVVGMQYGLLLLAVVLCGYITSRPVLMKYYDATHTQKNTLAKESRELLEKLDGKLSLVTYVNYLDIHNYIAMPEKRLEDLKRFEKYRRGKPDLEMKYVYYYHRSENPYRSSFAPTLDDAERVKKLAEIDDLNPDLFCPAEALSDEVDLASEQYGFVRRFEYENGKKAFLRIYDDMKRHPFETEIAAPLKTLIEKSPLVTFVTGHGERNPYHQGDKGIGFALTDLASRRSLINEGFTIDTARLELPVSDSVDLLVLADMRQGLSERELQHLDAYLQRGGNFLLLGDNHRQEAMNPVADLLGLKFTDGVLVQSYPLNADIIGTKFTEEIAEKVPAWSRPARNGGVVVTPSAVAIEQTAEKGYVVTDVLRTESPEVWNEKQTVDFTAGAPGLNAAAGEKKDTYAVAKYLTRQVGAKEQRIFVWGDVDCFTYDAIRQYRLNGALIPGVYEHLTDNRFPVNVRTPMPDDNRIIMSQQGLEAWKKGVIWGVPAVIALLFLFVWISRRRR